MGEFDIDTRPATLPTKDEAVGVMVQYMELGLKISTTITFSIQETVLMEIGEVGLGIKPVLIPPIIQVILVYYQVLQLW